MFEIKKASRKRAKLRMAIDGAPGSGKTFTAIAVGTALGKTVVIDSERGSAELYSDAFNYDHLNLPSFEPETYANAIKYAEQAGYEVIVIDSLSHAWFGTGGVLEQVEKAGKREGGGNFAGWKTGTKMQNSLLDTILGSGCHIIATMRSKFEYVQEKDDRGKTVIRKVGLKPIQRDDIEFEFTLYGSMSHEHELVVQKTRISSLVDAVLLKPGADLAKQLLTWLNSGDEPAAANEHHAVVLATALADQPVDAMDAHNWVDVLTKQCAAVHIPQKFLNAYIKKRGGAESLTENQYLDAIAFMSNAADKMAEKYGDTYTADQVLDADVKAIFVELDK